MTARRAEILCFALLFVCNYHRVGSWSTLILSKSKKECVCKQSCVHRIIRAVFIVFALLLFGAALARSADYADGVRLGNC